MRPENKRMQDFLRLHGIEARVKYMSKGSIRGCWRLYHPQSRWTQEIEGTLTSLGFVNLHGQPLGPYSGNGGMFSVLVRGHNELLS